MKKWNEEKISYIRNANSNQLMPSAENIFIIECEYMSLDKDESVPQKNQRVISLLVIFNITSSIDRTHGTTE